jgi:hypothetical protein
VITALIARAGRARRFTCIIGGAILEPARISKVQTLQWCMVLSTHT